MVSGALPAKGNDLATGTTAPSRVRRRWPILDVHDVKQRNAILPRSPKRCASASKLGHAHTSSQPQRFTRAASLPASWRAGMNPERRIARANTPGQAEIFVCFESFGPFGPSCLFGGGLAHRRISPVFSIRNRIDTLGMRNRHSRARRRNRPVAYSTGRWRRR
jgi:hypothetical protein